jgi:hypothetical protein
MIAFLLGYGPIQSVYGATRTELTPMHKIPDNSKALASFISCKTEIDSILARLSTLSAEHFHRAPDDISWGDVGTLGSYLEDLSEVSDSAFHEGEYAA